MGITKILLKKGIVVAGIKYNVLIPLPATHDVCMEKIGLNDFDDSDDEWDANFSEIIECLIAEEEYRIVAINPRSMEKEPINCNSVCDIQGYLAQCDHLNFLIQLDRKSITFTRGHEILWLDGSFDRRIEMIRYPIILSENKKIAELF
jgi:hypothetical protein